MTSLKDHNSVSPLIVDKQNLKTQELVLPNTTHFRLSGTQVPLVNVLTGSSTHLGSVPPIMEVPPRISGRGLSNWLGLGQGDTWLGLGQGDTWIHAEFFLTWPVL